MIIRPFVRGQDEATWVDITNRAWREDEDFTPDTVEDLKRWDDAPWIGVQAMSIAEVDGVPVAKVRAETDKTMAEKKGLHHRPGRRARTPPQGHRHGAHAAGLSSLCGAGMETAEVGSFDNPAPQGLLDTLGFRVVRRFCRMRRTLAGSRAASARLAMLR